MVTTKTRRLVNPEKKIGSPRAARPHPKQTNPASLILLGTVNPQRKVMAKTQKKQHKPAARKNPFPFSKPGLQKSYKPKRHGARRNPEALDMLKQPVNVVKFGLFALLGLLATRQIPQFILKEKNAGWMGYLANLGTATAGGLAAGKFVSKQDGSAVMIGGGLYLVNRFLTEQLAPIGNVLKLAGTGDAAASPSLGRIRDAYFPAPIVRDRNGNPIIPKEIDANAVRALIAAQQQKPAPSGVAGTSRVAGVSSRMQGRLAA